MGRRYYMSPEQMSSKRQRGPAQRDIWELALILYEIAYRPRMPFEAEKTMPQLFAADFAGPPRPSAIYGRIAGRLPGRDPLSWRKSRDGASPNFADLAGPRWSVRREQARANEIWFN